MTNDQEDHVVELVSRNINSMMDTDTSELSEEITPLLTQQHKPKINIFTISYAGRKPREQVMKVMETDVSLFTQFISWTWEGSNYSGLLCMGLSSTIYSVMEILSHIFSVGSIPLFERVFTRCMVIMILSFVWLRKTRQPMFGPSHIRNLLVSRALVGYLSLLGFVYSVKTLPLSMAIIVNFLTPIMASLAARIILQEKLKLVDIGGLICSFFGLLSILLPQLINQGRLAQNGEPSNINVVRKSHPIYAILVASFSSIMGGVSYCLIRAVAKSSDEPVITVFSFSLLACPAAALCTFALQDFVLPDISSFLFMVVLGGLAFFAEVLLARGLQLEKTARVTNMQYFEPFLLEIWSILLSRPKPSIGGIFGSMLILVSLCSTIYFGPEKEIE